MYGLLLPFVDDEIYSPQAIERLLVSNSMTCLLHCLARCAMHVSLWFHITSCCQRSVLLALLFVIIVFIRQPCKLANFVG